MKLKIATQSILIGSIVAGIVSFLAAQHQTRQDAVSLALSATNGILALGAVPLFLASLKRFSKEYRRAYTVFCVGMTLLGISQLSLWAISFFHITSAQVSGLSVLPYVLSFFVKYAGLRMSAKVLRIRTAWLSLPRLLLAILILSPILWFLPHVTPPTGTTELVFDGTLVMVGVMGTFESFSAGLVLSIKRNASAIYGKAMQALFWPLATFAFAAFAYIFLDATGVTGNVNNLGIVGVILAVVGGFLFLRAAYVQNFVGVGEESLQKPIGTASSIDIVVRTAALVSNPLEIDPILDKLREITSGIAPGQSLTAGQQQALATIYLQLEEYLTTREPAQTFTKESLRGTLGVMLDLSPASTGTFWPSILNGTASPAEQPK